MSNDQYEETILRARAVIAANQATAKDIAKAILPDKKEHEAHVRTLEWLRGEYRLSNMAVFLRLQAWVDKAWRVTGKRKTELNAQFKQLTEQPK